MKITKAVIPVAGKGTRFLPASKDIPKEMIPIINWPMIHYPVQEAVDSGIEEIIFIVSKGKEALVNYFKRNKELENFLESNGKNKELELCKKIGSMANIVTVEQLEQKGLGHAILCAEKHINNNNFAVLVGDDVVMGKTPATKQLINISDKMKHSSVIGVMKIDKKDSNKYGIVDGAFCSDDKKTILMKGMVEKPPAHLAPSDLASPGRYIFSKEIFKHLKEIPLGVGGEYQLTDAINLLAQKEDVYAYVFEGERFDTGSIQGFLDATVDFSLRNSETSEMMETIIRNKVKKFNIKI